MRTNLPLQENCFSILKDETNKQMHAKRLTYLLGSLDHLVLSLVCVVSIAYTGGRVSGSAVADDSKKPRLSLFFTPGETNKQIQAKIPAYLLGSLDHLESSLVCVVGIAYTGGRVSGSAVADDSKKPRLSLWERSKDMCEDQPHTLFILCVPLIPGKSRPISIEL